MSNLIPTPIVDKNGVPSIRHKKPMDSSAHASLPAPNASTPSMKALNADAPRGAAAPGTESRTSGNFITRWQDRRKRTKLTESLIDTLFPDKSNLYAGTSPKSLMEVMGETLSTAEVEMAADIARLVTRDGISSEASDKDRKSIIWSLHKSMKAERTGIRVRALHAHADWLRAHPGEAENLRKTIENLMGLDMMKNGGNDGIEHLDEYMAASLHPAYDSFTIIHIWREGFLNAAVRYPDQIDHIVPYITSRRGFKEDGFDDYMSAAAKHPDKIDRMIDYITERGTFNEGGFEQYINAAAPLAEGAL